MSAGPDMFLPRSETYGSNASLFQSGSDRLVGPNSALWPAWTPACCGLGNKQQTCGNNLLVLRFWLLLLLLLLLLLRRRLLLLLLPLMPVDEVIPEAKTVCCSDRVPRSRTESKDAMTVVEKVFVVVSAPQRTGKLASCNSPTRENKQGFFSRLR